MAPDAGDSVAATYTWSDTYETERQVPSRSEDRRSEFERDRDRVIHSVAFRRLQGKTQIFASHMAGPMRTRLTHTLEVAQIGEAIGLNHDLPAHLVEAACLAHDLGHPPFGHYGEAALREVMKPYGGFDSNAQSLRIVTRLEAMKRKQRGMNLCRATLQGILKYPYERKANAVDGDAPGSDSSILEEVTEEDGTKYVAAQRHFIYDDDVPFVTDYLLRGNDIVKLREAGDRKDPPRTLVCSIMDWADDIAYSVHDLEDGIFAGFLVPDSFTSEPVANAVLRSVLEQNVDWGSEGEPGRGDVLSQLNSLQAQLREFDPTSNLGVLREVTRSYIDRLVSNTGVVETEATELAFGFKLKVQHEDRLLAETLKALTREYLLKDPRTTRYMFKGRHMIQQLFRALQDNPQIIDATPDQLLEREDRESVAKEGGDRRARARVVCDYLSGLTEGQLIALYQTMFEATGSGSWLAHG